MMFRRSALFLLAVFSLVFGLGFYTQWQTIQKLPSYYDPGIRIDKAFRSSPHPLLVEFYSDACQGCQLLTPMVHQVAGEMKQQLTLVMVNVQDPANRSIAELFGVTDIPRLYVFDAHRMKKKPVTLPSSLSVMQLRQYLSAALPSAS